jgi:ABC-type sugar transport system ATPase subunit
VPPERKRDGLVLVLSIQANLVLLVLRQLARWGVIRPRLEQSRARELARNSMSVTRGSVRRSIS